jgi:iduronate 2-sulfatase
MNNVTARELRLAYYACVTHMDFELGRVLDAVWGGEYAENTVITLVGDHGWQLGEHGEWARHSLSTDLFF